MTSNTPLRFISSMATRQLMADLAQHVKAQGGPAIEVESVGGVDAAKRVAAGEAFDGVVLAADAIDKLITVGQVLPSRIDLVRSSVVAAVREGAVAPDIGSEAALKQAILQAPSVGYSTGPSGVALVKLFERWGITQALAGKLVQAPAGVPVGRLIAQGQMALGFQQLSELMSEPGVQVVGPLPAEIQIVTTFSGGVCARSSRADQVSAVLTLMASAQVQGIRESNGMQAP